jgi:hypothetical protein
MAWCLIKHWDNFSPLSQEWWTQQMHAVIQFRVIYLPFFWESEKVRLCETVILIVVLHVCFLKEGSKLRIFQNKVQRRLFCLNKDKLIMGFIKMVVDKGLQNECCPLSRVLKTQHFKSLLKWAVLAHCNRPKWVWTLPPIHLITETGPTGPLSESCAAKNCKCSE